MRATPRIAGMAPKGCAVETVHGLDVDIGRVLLAVPATRIMERSSLAAVFELSEPVIHRES